MKKAFFLDRDGTLNVDFDYVHLPTQWEWCEGVIDSIRWMNQQDWLVIVVTNQSGVVRGRYGMKQVQTLHRWVDGQLAIHQAHIDAWYVAPFHPEFHAGLDPAWLAYRKPGTGMFTLAQREWDIDFRQSVMVGDKISDLIPAVALGIRPFFVRSVHEPQQDQTWLLDHHIPCLNHLGEVIDAIRISS